MNSNTNKERRIRSQRPDAVLTARDRQILSLVHEHRFLTVDLIWRLMRDDDHGSPDYALGKDGRNRPKRYGFGEKALYRRLRTLSLGGFLVPRRLTDQPYGGLEGSPPRVFALGPKAAVPLAELVGVSVPEVRRIVEANKVGLPFMRHALEVATFKATLKLACHASGARVKLLFWEQGVRLRDEAVGRNEKGDDERFSVYPDAFFGLEVAGQGRTHCCLEIDRGTMPIVASSNKPDLRKKIMGYRWYRQSGTFSRRYFYQRRAGGLTSSLVILENGQQLRSERSDLQPISGFTALFVMPGSIRADGSIAGRLANMLSTIPTFGEKYATSSMFWFTSSASIDIERPLSIFDRFWLTPNPDKGLQSLIE